MIKIFGSTDTDFVSNGDKILNAGKAKVHKADNSDYYLDVECGLEYVDFLTQGRIIVAPTPTGDQAFRVKNVEKRKDKVRVRAWHVFYDAQNYIIAETQVVNKTANDALDQLNSAVDNPSPFTTLSDISTQADYHCVRQTLYHAIQAVIEQWGGHLVRDNFSIALRDSIGQDNGVTVRYGKNIRDINCEENWDSTVTKLLPVGKDELMLPEVYVYSAVQYDIPYTKCIHFEQDLELEDYEDEDAYEEALIDDLRAQAEAYLTINQYPQVNYTLKANLEKVTDIGDTVEVIDERLGINILTHIIGYDWDCITARYTELVFGNFTQKLSDLIQTINHTTEQAITENSNILSVKLSAELTQATDSIWSALSDSYVIYEGDKILVVDSLPKETATNVIMINNGGIAFSQTGINGVFNSAWTIDGTMDMQRINVINLVADMIKGGTLKLGGALNQAGILELYDESSQLIGQMDKSGLKMYGADGSYVVINETDGFAGYNANDVKIYWADKDEFHMKKSVVEEEITLCQKMRFIPITIYSGNAVLNDGVGLVSTN